MSAPLMAATPMMAQNGLSWDDITGVAVHVVNVLQTQGATAIDDVQNIMKLVKAVTGRDLAGVFAAFNAVTVDTNSIIAAVKAEFQIP